MNYKILSLVFLSFMLITMVSAVKPDTQLIENGCAIEAPVFDSVKLGVTIKSHIHVLNTTTNANNFLTSPISNCSLHLYRYDGSHLFEMNYSWDSNGMEWEQSILGGNLSYVGPYGYYIQCITPDSICGVRGGFETTPSGFVDTFNFYILILIILVAIIFLGFSIKEHWFVILGGMGLIAFGLYTMNNGLVGQKDMFMTWIISIFEISVGAILSIGAGIQKMDYD